MMKNTIAARPTHLRTYHLGGSSCCVKCALKKKGLWCCGWLKNIIKMEYKF